MNEGMAFILLIVLLWGLFGIVCNITCAARTIKTAERGWHKVAGWVVIINVVLTILTGLARMLAG